MGYGEEERIKGLWKLIILRSLSKIEICHVFSHIAILRSNVKRWKENSGGQKERKPNAVWGPPESKTNVLCVRNNRTKQGKHMKKALPGSGVHVWLKHMSINSTGFQDTAKTPNKEVISTSVPLLEEVEGRTLYWVFARRQIVLDAEARQLNWALSVGVPLSRAPDHSLCKN